MEGSQGGALRNCITAPAIIRRTGTTRESRWTRTIPTASSSTRSTSGLQRARELSGTISPAVIPTAAAQVPCTWTNMRSRSCPAHPAFWQSGMMAASTELQTRTLQRRPPIRPGLTWTRVLTRSSSTPATSAATSPMLLLRRQVAARRTTALAQSLLPAPPTGPVLWQLGVGGDGFYSRIDPVGTGSSLRFLQGNNSGGMIVVSVTARISMPLESDVSGSWCGDTRSFILPYDLFHGGIPGGDDCPPAGVPGGCGHLIAGNHAGYGRRFTAATLR